MANPVQGYFDSTTFELDVNGFPIWNRAVGSEFMAKFAHTVLGDGAAGVTTGGFQVVKKTGMIVTVKPYFIAKNGYMMYQTAETDIEFTSSTSEQVFYIGARLDVANNHFENDDVHAYTTFVADTDIASCKLTITANAVTITDGMIKDLRYDTAYCGQLDEYRVRSIALIAELEDALATTLAGGMPDHAITHAAAGDDPIDIDACNGVQYIAQTLSDAEQIQVRANISAAETAVDNLSSTSTTAALSANQGKQLDNLKNSARVLLWTNPSPNSNFAAQDVDLTLTDYDAVLIEAAGAPTASAIGNVDYIVAVGETKVILYPYYRNEQRSISVTTTKVTFGTGQIFAKYNDSSTTDTTAAIIPMRIYGIKHLFVD